MPYSSNIFCNTVAAEQQSQFRVRDSEHRTWLSIQQDQMVMEGWLISARFIAKADCESTHSSWDTKHYLMDFGVEH